ncbi:MAG TPA: GxxExxY protein [Gemmatimonadaceae bacterium]|nr:GxxExxY protein [Gemmatimonadaceae bacterium]
MCPVERDPLTAQIIGAAIKVHRRLGPGLLESTYEQCLTWELVRRRLRIKRQVPVTLAYDGFVVSDAYRLDLLVEERVVVEVKAVEKLNSVHHAQLLTYLKLSGYPVGLLLNFHELVLRDGIKRFVM